jgi:hypothetical protein
MHSDSEAISELTANHYSGVLLILKSLHACGVLNRLLQEPFTYKHDYNSTLLLVGHETGM